MIKTLCHYEQKDFCPHTASLEAIHQTVHPEIYTNQMAQECGGSNHNRTHSHVRSEWRVTYVQAQTDFHVGFSHGKDA